MTNDSRQPFPRRPTRRQFLQVAATALPALTLSSCGWTLANVQSTTTAQSSTDVLYIYTWAGYTDQDLLDRFQKETGIAAIADVFDSNEAMLARLQAGGGGAYSIIYPSDYMVQKMMGLKMLTELDRSRLVSLDRLFPRFQNPEYDPDNTHSVPVSWGTTGLIYNTKKLQPPPEDWGYLWEYQQQLSKRMTLLNDVREVMGAALKVLGYSYNSTNPKHIQAAYQKLADLKPALAAFTSDAWRPQILSGDLMIAMCYSSDANEVIPENRDLQYVLPASGSSLWMDTLAIPKTAPNVEGAYAWINFMLQPDVAAQVCERLSFATPNQDAFKLLPSELKENRSMFPPKSALEHCQSLDPLEDYEEVYDRYWTKLTSG
ncbi:MULTISPECIES: ABC transporter substrate-binding protein [unclassified Coleofasciculus]|uniref:ABC transporter substrate-binding protein n=1 Tax=unclassified Coleofasciculus TaxID=2692782 RepID=UPI00187FC29E|nr:MULTISPECIES: spermidine/putrescine ABC transporter substrate-binding protein [unclassified Coleofasciculus]MBE9125151.1 spermidine/putrescine ABC transporter substrate-binding protein [Coleofasciculus sp. LEGE 07081]MBE9148368.1 spermidine/putrescine ABC transporter substrate-binding protein [Coleofasciculus sp. LEGE 07092]